MEPNHQTCPHCRTPLTLRKLIDAQYIDQAKEVKLVYFILAH